MNNYLSGNGIIWLQKIFQERFGNSFLLQANHKNEIELTILNSIKKITFFASPKIFTRNDSDLPCCEWDANTEGWQAPLNCPLPAPGVSSLSSPVVTLKANGMYVAYDIPGLVYWSLSRLEEVGRIDLDEHGRFPATSSHAYKHGYLERPVVDEWLNIVEQIIKTIWPDITLNQNSFSMKVSHDVDEPSRYGFRNTFGIMRAVAGDLFKRRKIKSAFLAPWVRATTRSQLSSYDPYNTFNWIMNISEMHSLKSAFYFICGHTNAFDADYQPGHPAIRKLMRDIHDRGHEIGLHPSYDTYRKPQLIKKEAERLKQICADEGIKQDDWGGRMHYLRWEHPLTLTAWSDAGMKYDSTLSFADRPGFRCGTCFEYPAFNPVTQDELPLRVRPLITMECTIMDKSYMGLGQGESALNKFAQMKEACRSVDGCFTLLWHNSELENDKKRDLYRAVLKI